MQRPKQSVLNAQQGFRTIRPVDFETSKKLFTETATGWARERLEELLVCPVIPPFAFKEKPGDVLARNRNKARPGLTSLHEIVHAHAITELTREQLCLCGVHEQVASIMRNDVDAEFMTVIKSFWHLIRDWMTEHGTTLASIHRKGTPDAPPLFDITNDEVFDASVYERKPVPKVEPEKAWPRDHREAGVLVKNLISAFCCSFAGEWRQEVEETDAYRRIAEFSPLATIISGKNGTPSAHLRGGINTMVSTTINSLEKLCEFIEVAISPEAIDEDSPILQTAVRDHTAFLAEKASFGIVPFTHLEEILLASLQKPGTISPQLLDFYRRTGFVFQPEQTGAATESIRAFDAPYISRYFGLRGLEEQRPLLDLNIETLTETALIKMSSSALYTGCHARGEVMKEMTRWVTELYCKFVIPMYAYERRSARTP